MSINRNELDQLVGALQGFVEAVQLGTQSSDPMVIGDFPNATLYSHLATTAAMATLINRYFAEHPDVVNKPDKARVMATT